MRNSTVVVFDGIDADTDATSEAVPCPQGFSASFIATIAGGTTPAGEFQIEVSNDPAELKSPEPENWAVLDNADIAFTDNGTVMIPKFDICYNWIRVVYDETSASDGTIVGILRVNGY